MHVCLSFQFIIWFVHIFRLLVVWALSGFHDINTIASLIQALEDLRPIPPSPSHRSLPLLGYSLSIMILFAWKRPVLVLPLRATCWRNLRSWALHIIIKYDLLHVFHITFCFIIPSIGFHYPNICLKFYVPKLWRYCTRIVLRELSHPDFLFDECIFGKIPFRLTAFGELSYSR